MCDRDHKPQFSSLPVWLLIAAFSLAFSTRHALATDDAQPAAKEPLVSANTISARLPDRITTLDGKTYEKVTLEKVDPDGLLVLFSPVEGGSGSVKLKFRNLPAELRERFGYDPAQASNYESARARGEAIWLTESAAWSDQHRAALAEQATWERQMRAQAEAHRAAETEQALVEAAQQPGYYYPGWSWWPGNYNRAPHHSGLAPRHNHMLQRTSPVGNRSSPISPIIGPMRPGGR